LRKEISGKEEMMKMKIWIILITILIIIASMIIFPGNPAHTLLLQYVSTLSTWPFVILIIGLVLLLNYKGPISERIKTLLIKTKGLEISRTPQAEPKLPEERKLKEFTKKLET